MRALWRHFRLAFLYWAQMVKTRLHYRADFLLECLASLLSQASGLAVVGIINAVISVYYYWNVVRCMYLLPPRTSAAVPLAPGVRTALALSVLGTLGLFLLAQQLLLLVNGRV